MPKKERTARDEILTISKMFPLLRFGQFLRNVTDNAGHLDLYFASDESILEACRKYVRDQYKEG